MKAVGFDPATLIDELGVDNSPPFVDPAHALFQLRYLATYLAHPEVACRSILLEGHYIDRDHMEDHSVFYSRNLFPYKNHCQRAHFFKMDVGAVGAEFERIIELGRSRGVLEYHAACRAFSEKNYLGFIVVKPLTGSPVGRTVLRPFPSTKPGDSDYERRFTCTRRYVAHVGGIELSVRGLAFQQQDKAVAACATTAIWSALHRTRVAEEIATFTPAQITALATRNSLPFGRSMPSEGLSVDQMSQAVQAIGASPVLRRATDFLTARGLLYSALRSGIAPVLVITDGGAHHAVAAVGMGLRKNTGVGAGIMDAATNLEALYLHDDRIGPYLRADILEENSRAWLRMKVPPAMKAPDQPWMITHILFPMHAKIRVTFSELRELALNHVAVELEAYRRAIRPDIRAGLIAVESWIDRAHVYQEAQLLEPSAVDTTVLHRMLTTLSLSRYVGVIRVCASYLDPIQVLVDTTSTERNIFAIGVLAEGAAKQATREFATHLAERFQCMDRLILPA